MNVGDDFEGRRSINWATGASFEMKALPKMQFCCGPQVSVLVSLDHLEMAKVAPGRVPSSVHERPPPSFPHRLKRYLRCLFLLDCPPGPAGSTLPWPSFRSCNDSVRESGIRPSPAGQGDTKTLLAASSPMN